MAFDLATRTFTLEYKVDRSVNAPTEIFVPDFQYPNGYVVEVSGGTYSVDQKAQMLLVTYTDEATACKVTVIPNA